MRLLWLHERMGVFAKISIVEVLLKIIFDNSDYKYSIR